MNRRTQPIGLLCSQTVVLDADSGTDLIEKPRRRGRCACGAGRRVCHYASLRNSVLERLCGAESGLGVGRTVEL